MAVDEVLMESVRDGSSPILRFYDWEKSCLSIGYFQTFAQVNAAKCKQQSIEIVRRLTGGNALLHKDCLTYSVILPKQSALVREGVVQSFHRITQPFSMALHDLGIPITSASESGTTTGSFDCLATLNPSEIGLGTRKIFGSAQTRRRGIVLQHGSLILGHPTDISELTTTHTASPLRGPTVLDFLPNGISGLHETITSCCSSVWSARFDVEVLSASEKHRARSLAKERYRRQEWTEIR